MSVLSDTIIEWLTKSAELAASFLARPFVSSNVIQPTVCKQIAHDNKAEAARVFNGNKVHRSVPFHSREVEPLEMLPLFAAAVRRTS